MRNHLVPDLEPLSDLELVVRAVSFAAAGVEHSRRSRGEQPERVARFRRALALSFEDESRRCLVALDHRDFALSYGFAGDPPERCSLADFVRANIEDSETCHRVAALQLGESYEGGGGAAPAYRVERVSGR